MTAVTCLPLSAASCKRLDDRRIAAGAVKRLLDGQHAFVLGGGLDEIDDVAERFVGMMHQDIAGPDGREDARRADELGHRLRHELRIAQVREAGQTVNLKQPGQIEQVVGRIDVARHPGRALASGYC